jgi:hypothetical protein
VRLTRPRGATAALALVALAAPAAAQATPKLHDGQTGFKVRPTTILVSGDGSAWLGGRASGSNGDYGRIRWHTFGRSGARGIGRIFLSDCDPDCASGAHWKARAGIRATRVRDGHYTRLSARYRRSGHAVTKRWRLQVNSPTYAYWLPVGS